MRDSTVRYLRQHRPSQKGRTMNRLLITIVAILIEACAARAQEVKADSQIESASLFKNGLAVIRRPVQINGPGVYRLDNVPEPVHGTFWIEGDIPVSAKVSMRDIETPVSGAVNFQQDLAGKQVTIHLKEPGSTALAG